ncbi:hypothetical protein GCM10008967_20670 [Bacillus carboniphilus]|uniref:Cytochrome c oxidase subunit 2A n=1 Tax=Bacillus carboniphilus TaxID=86663 RepID=A0ABP3FYI7_9BACI
MNPEIRKTNEAKKMKAKLESDIEKNLKGTFASVLLLGGFIVLSWAGVFFLFLSRT